MPGIWWNDLQIDGVKKGYTIRQGALGRGELIIPSSLAKHHKERLPQPGSIIASSYTSPIDSLYLAAIFDPVFTASFPSTRRLERVSLFQAMLRAFRTPQIEAPTDAKLTDLDVLIKEYPHQAIVVFPECTTTNGRGILPFSTSLLSTPLTAKIFPISLRYTTGDITTPVPGLYISFLWNLLSKPTHCIRVRIAESTYNKAIPYANLDVMQEDRGSSSDTLLGSEEGEYSSSAEKKVLERVAGALARLGKGKTVGLTLKDKIGFVNAYTKTRR